MPVPWDEDPPDSETLILVNSRAILQTIADAADRRDPPTVAMAQDWHRQLYAGIQTPVSYYVGEVRDSDPRFPELVGYEVVVGTFAGVPAADVPGELVNFERQTQTAAGLIDAAIPAGGRPTTPRMLQGILTFCAYLHGEWLRIHPFANGNGRTSRVWANWAAIRYGLPPFVTVKPRPLGPYGTACAASMLGDHTAVIAAFDKLLREALSRLPP